jgi:hypothetical protein
MVIDPEETKRSLFGGLRNSATSKVEKSKTSSVKNVEPTSLPKWKRLEKVTVLLTNEQRDAIEDIARQVMRFRSKEPDCKSDRERITANTVVRALLESFICKAPSLEMEAISNEEELRRWVERLFR